MNTSLNAETISVALFYAANVGFCLAYLVRDLMWLRAITVVAALTTFPYFLIQDTPLYSALLWQTLFAVINVGNIIQLLNAKKRVALTTEQQLLKDMVFRNFTYKETKALLSLAEWKTASPNELLLRRDQRNNNLLLIFRGQVQIRHGRKELAVRGPGNLLGEMSYSTGRPSVADVMALDAVDYVSWTHDTLHDFLNRRPQLKTTFNALLTANMARKLES